LNTEDKERLAKTIIKARKDEISAIAEAILLDDSLFGLLLEFSFSESHPLGFRATWVLDYAAQSNPGILKPYLSVIIEKMPGFKSHTQMGVYLNLLKKYDLECDNLGTLVTVYFDNLTNMNYPSYVRLASLENLVNICKREPDLSQELILVLEELVAKAPLKEFEIRHYKKVASWFSNCK